MIGGDLFQRFFLRFLMAMTIAFFVFMTLVHVFQMRTVDREWREDLRQEAHWLALHSFAGQEQDLARAWKTTHSTIRLTLFDAQGGVIADSHPERSPLDLQALRAGRTPRGSLAAMETRADGSALVMSRPWVPAFPYGLRWELLAAALLLVGIVFVALYPLVSSMSRTLRRLTEMAEEVRSGHFGKTLSPQRAGRRAGANRSPESIGELGTLVRAFNEMSTRLAEAEQLNTRLLHDVSHELRSPLGRIQVLAQTIDLRPEQTAECIQGIEQEVALLDRLVGDLVETARIESGPPSSRMEVFDLKDWARSTLSRLESKARSRGVTWVARLADADRSGGPELEVRGDAQRLAQALGNLVDNALHALSAHGVDDARIEVTLAVADERWSLTVADNGPGIPEDDLPHVFRRFYRVDPHRDREQGGVGLGLALVRAIAEAHGGSATIECDTGAGTRATLSIPVDPAPTNGSALLDRVNILRGSANDRRPDRNVAP